ncbi:hypothetical protein ALC57_11470 [Trachymyrmex cornetzi]|uniref:Uncharacterized protein n=1 Tax=Trachymyrmex cornetzi TaxID=471704 RepID=A0A195DUM9_9HYME|nr:hypothetical protein ALC57_11470 [Trachymyrmex cornetzi]
MLGAQPESIFMHAHAFLRLNEDAKRPPGIRDTPFIDEDGHLSGLLKIYIYYYITLPHLKKLRKVFKEKVDTSEDDNSGHFKQGEREVFC